jgi:hypothetical protein
MSLESTDQQLPPDFSAEVYLALNPDVRAAGVDPEAHYLNHGKTEGRPYKATYAADGLWTSHGHDFIRDPRFVAAYERGLLAAGGTFPTWHWRVHVGLWCAQNAVRLPGDYVECGVGRGFLSSAIMQFLDWNSLSGRTYYLVDTFSGIDVEQVADERRQAAMEENAVQLAKGVYATSAEAVKRNFAEWPSARVIVGSAPEALAHVGAKSIAFLHIDMNNAAPEIAALSLLWDRLVRGAHVLLDDYAYEGYEEQRAAMNRLADQIGFSILSLPTGQGLIIR